MELLSCLQGEPLTEKSEIEHRRSAFWWLEGHQITDKRDMKLLLILVKIVQWIFA